VFHPKYSSLKRGNASGHGKKTVLISLGGGADSGFSEKLIGEVMKRFSKIQVIAIQGPAQEKINVPRSTNGRSLTLLGPQPSLAPWLRKSDVAITAGGGTLYDLAHFGVPGIAVAKKEHQKRNIRLFMNEGTVLNAGDSLNRKSARRAAALVARLFTDKKQYQAMSRAGRLLIDGEETGRVLHIIERMLEGEKIKS
jgi:UDP-N-acetylglucosamine:LPS N-acetylglucosamine transferase